MLKCAICSRALVVGKDTFYEIAHVFKHEPGDKNVERNEMVSVERVEICDSCWDETMGSRVIARTMDVNRKE